MALETRSSQALDTVHSDVLSQARLACYKARDAFYTCLEKEANKKPTEIASVGLLYPVECKKNREEYVKQCRPTWVISVLSNKLWHLLAQCMSRTGIQKMYRLVTSMVIYAIWRERNLRRFESVCTSLVRVLTSCQTHIALRCRKEPKLLKFLDGKL